MDLCRTSAGEWRVIGNRTQPPAGPGFTLENRVIISNVLAGIFHRNSVMRVAPFFINLQEYLRGASFYNRDDPQIVLLSPGPASETYFEQAFLSRYLGYPLVESGDLTVRDDKVYVKTLGGLEPVDMIFRWIGDSDCDPLSLRGDPNLGVSGLIQAARTQNVAVVNPIGAGVLERPAFSTVLPGLCREILREEPLLEDLPALWCGNPGSLARVIGDMERYAVRSAFNVRKPFAADCAKMSGAEKEILMEQMRFAPYEYMAQEKTELSTIPTLSEGGAGPRRVICRFYISATKEGFQVMPGGLARVSDEGESLLLSLGEAALSKDIWVMSDGPVEQVSLMERMEKAVEIRLIPRISAARVRLPPVSSRVRRIISFSL